MERVQNGPLARKARGQRSSLAAEMRDVTWKVHPGRSTEKPASPLQWDRDVEVSSSPTLSPSEASTLEGRFTWRASDIDEELWDPCTPQESPRAGVSTKCFTPPALSRAEMKDADVRPVQPNQITVFDGRSGLPQDVLRQPKLMVNHMRKHQDRPDILMQCCVWLQLQVQKCRTRKHRLAYARKYTNTHRDAWTQAHSQARKTLISKIASAGCHGCEGEERRGGGEPC